MDGTGCTALISNYTYCFYLEREVACTLNLCARLRALYLCDAVREFSIAEGPALRSTIVAFDIGPQSGWTG